MASFKKHHSMPRQAKPLAARLENLIRKTSGCWFLRLKTKKSGYTQIRVNRRSRPGHVVVYEHFVGPVPSGLVLDHTCRVQCCVRPSHLDPVTQRVNVLRSRNHVALLAIATHCTNGHPFDDKNTYHRPSGGRACKTCSLASGRKNYSPEARHTKYLRVRKH